MGFVDIHCHLLYGVDDGAKTIEDSCKMLAAAKEDGISHMILTPHYRHGMFAFPLDAVGHHYEQLIPQARQFGIRLFLGCECHVNSRLTEYLQQGRCLTLADSEYVLTEYAFETSFSYILEQTGRLLNTGYIPVVAHVERYGCIQRKPDLVERLRRMGARIQVDANAVIGLDGHMPKKCCRKLLKSHMADIVASDSHDTARRGFCLRDCCAYIGRKYGQDYAEALLCRNPGEILAGSG